jgi:hypothetical protein
MNEYVRCRMGEALVDPSFVQCRRERAPEPSERVVRARLDDAVGIDDDLQLAVPRVLLDARQVPLRIQDVAQGNTARVVAEALRARRARHVAPSDPGEVPAPVISRTW